MRRRNRRRIGVVGHCPTPPPPVDAIGRNNHVFVNPADVVVGAVHTLVSLFCGAGGIDVGFEQAGFRTVLAVEMDEDAAATYQHNFPFCDLVLCDIRDVTDEEVLARLGGVEVDVLAAGWPCQGISPVGLQAPDDPRNVLYREAVRFARLLRPHFVIFENVPALLDAKRRWLLDDLLALLADGGYPNASVMQLDAVDYGVPQHRERVITVANRDDLLNPFPFPLPPECGRTAGEALDDLLSVPDTPWMSHVRRRHGEDTRRALARIRAGDCSDRRSTLVRRLLDQDRPSLAAIYCRGNRFVHYAEDRLLTPREYARLQGFPDEHVFEGCPGSAGTQICNAVPPPMARSLALAVRTMLEGGGVTSTGEVANNATDSPCPAGV